MNKVCYTKEFEESLRKCFGGGWYAIARFFDDIWCEVCAFPENFLRGLDWFLFMYHNRIWQSHHLYNFLIKRLVQIERHIKKYSHYTSRSSDCRLLRLAIFYLNKSHEDDMEDPLYKAFEEKYGKIKWVESPCPDNDGLTMINTYRTKCHTEQEQDYANKLHYRIFQLYNRRMKKYRKKSFDIITKYFDYWNT